jgi:putative aldouronate transport system permease protein
VTRNTIAFNLVFLVTGTVSQVAFAVMISEMTGEYYKRIVQSLSLMPFFVSMVVVASLAYAVLNYEFGALNRLLGTFGAAPVNFYARPALWYLILPLVSIWKGIGYGSIIYIASISGIDPGLFESAVMDGANTLQRIRFITLPSIMPTIVIMTLFALGRLLRGNFELFYQLIGTSPMLFNTTDIIETLVFRALVDSAGAGGYPMASSASLYQSVLCFITIVVANKLVKTYNEEYSLF